MSLAGTETLLVTGTSTTGGPAAENFLTTTGAIAALASSGGAGETINTAITTAGAGTLTGAAITGGVITRSGPVAAYSDTTDTAALIVAAIGAPFIGQSFFVHIKNTVNFTQTILAGGGVTLSGSVVVPANSVALYLVTLTSLSAVTFLHIETALLTNNIPEVVTALTTVGNGTITAAGIAGGVTTRGGSQSATPFTDTTATADQIIAAQANSHVGVSWEYTYKNNTNAVATITGASGVTVSGFTVIPANAQVTYLVTYTAASTVTMAGIAAGQMAADATDATKVIGFKASGMTTGKTTLIAAVNSNDATYTLPAATDTLAGIGTAQTWTAAQTITNSDLKLLGSSTGANTFTALNSTATNYTSSVPAVTGVLASTSGANLYIADIVKCGTQKDSTTATLAAITGLTQTVAIGTYKFRLVLSGSADGTGGVKYAFKYTTAVCSVMEAIGMGMTASAIAVQHTTTATDEALLFDQAAAVIAVVIEGVATFTTGGTVALETAQHTNNGTSSTYINSTMEFIRIA